MLNKLIFVGDLNYGTRSLSRYKILNKKFSFVKVIKNEIFPYQPGIHKKSYLSRIFARLRIPLDQVNLNNELRKVAVLGINADLLWVEKSVSLHPSTLKFFKCNNPGTKIILVLEDDMFLKHNQSIFFRNTLPLFDIIFTTKKRNLSELKFLGAKRTEFFLDSYDPFLHKQLPNYNSIKSKCFDVSFIGTFEVDRYETLLFLAKRGIKITVYGNNWPRNTHSNLDIRNTPLYGNDYTLFINQSKINLSFLRKMNRDQVTSRTMEIIGCSGFLMTEKTDEHEYLFEGNKEAIFFTNKNDLFKKINYYLNNNKLIKKIASNGKKRAIKSGYTMNMQIEKIIEKSFNSF
jgi:spore maturation protein CgeB